VYITKILVVHLRENNFNGNNGPKSVSSGSIVNNNSFSQNELAISENISKYSLNNVI